MQSRGSTHGDVPPVDGDLRPRHNPGKHVLVAWVIWLAFCGTVGALYFVGWQILPKQATSGSLPEAAFATVAAINSFIALLLRTLRARQPAQGRKFVHLVLGLAFGESVALAGLILHLNDGGPNHAVWFLIAAGLLQLSQAPMDFTAPSAESTDAPSGVTVI